MGAEGAEALPRWDLSIGYPCLGLEHDMQGAPKLRIWGQTRLRASQSFLTLSI
jgi:hypothetical protein